MNEGRTTAIFAVVAAVSFGLALWSRPSAISNMEEEADGVLGKSLFEKEFDDPSLASNLEIVKYDGELAQLKRFSVVKDSETSLWSLPSDDDYPADAAEQVRDATTPLIGLEVLNVISTDRGDHSLYGVVNPDDEDLSVAESGVGMLVTVKGEGDALLASLIIGKEVEDAENQRYVRMPSQDAVYQVELSTDAFTTDFQDWINSNVMDVRSFDITSINLRDYAVLPLQNGSYGISRKYDADVSFDTSTSKWALNRFVVYEGTTGVETQLAPGEVLQDSALNDLRSAVQDLEIVGVLRKPDGLAADLKADKSLAEDEESMRSLLAQGFFLQDTPRGPEMVATGGETIVGTDDGVQYLLRFGESSTQLGTDDDEDGISLRRYLLVSARLDESKFPPPELIAQPETVEEMLKMQGGPVEAEEETPVAEAESEAEMTETAPPQDEAAEGSLEESGDKKTAAENSEESTEEKAGEASKETPEAKKTEEAATADAVKKESAQPGKTDEAKKAEAEKTEAAKADAKTEDPASEPDPNDCGPQEEEPANAAASDSSPPADTATQAATPAEGSDGQDAESDQEVATSEPTQEELEEELQAVREQINKENQRKIDERNEQIDAARRKVQEVNARFADWYYVVSDSVYAKLKISKEQLIQDPTAAAPAGQPGFPGAPLGGTGLPPGLQLPPSPAGNN